jgi:YD repeat-containing protein
LLTHSPPSGAQQISYEYDALGRLIFVASPEGVAQYEYDAVGNILRITARRYADASGPVAILFVTPSKGAPGTTVHIYGKGFSATPADNQVAFNGTITSVTAATPSTLTVTVPSGATTGPISLTAPLGSATSPEPFIVLVFTLVPDQAVVARRGSVGFQAMLEGSLVTDVTWRVNDIVGGDATVGTISPSGVYTAPETIPATQPLLIEAVRTIDPSQVAKASVQVVDQAAGLASAAPVTVGLTQRTGVEIVAGAVTVGVTPAQGAQAMSGPLSVMGGPVLTAVTPATGAVGTSVALTLSGGNLQGATAVRFLWNGSVDTTLAASGIAPAGDGTSVSFSLTISGSATQGPRVVQVVTPQGASTNFDLGSNVFTVTSP